MVKDYTVETDPDAAIVFKDPPAPGSIVTLPSPSVIAAAGLTLDQAPVPTEGRLLHDGVRIVRQEAGRKGGSVSSVRKHKAAVGNGMKGGRPRKKENK